MRNLCRYHGLRGRSGINRRHVLPGGHPWRGELRVDKRLRVEHEFFHLFLFFIHLFLFFIHLFVIHILHDLVHYLKLNYLFSSSARLSQHLWWCLHAPWRYIHRWLWQHLDRSRR